MKRYFNTTGYCRTDMHYMVDPLRGIKNDNIYCLIENSSISWYMQPARQEKPPGYMLCLNK